MRRVKMKFCAKSNLTLRIGGQSSARQRLTCGHSSRSFGERLVRRRRQLTFFACSFVIPSLKNGREHATCASTPRHIRQSLGIAGASPVRPQGRSGRHCPGQPFISQCCILDFTHRGAMERSPSRLWRLEKYPSQILPLARQGPLGKIARNPCERT